MPTVRQVGAQVLAVRQLLAQLVQQLARLERSLRPGGELRASRSGKPPRPSRPSPDRP
jgi:hypothetical protein